ncbi:MAG TPA: hypothetical protein PKW55_02350 [Spirochaetota bacterium]|nr:hypothetical protein [Spirochaetota bacterium]HOM38311.1 hypothetical protein [Spirochaetota bacterium]HPQ48471.1 hypothetical protein [Spirochaetota bacterium]
MNSINIKKLVNSFDERYQKSIEMIQKMREIIEKGEHVKILETNKKLTTYILNKYFDENKN